MRKDGKIVWSIVLLLIVFSLAMPAWSAMVRADEPIEIWGSSESFSLSLKTKWNLISLPLVPDDNNIETVLADIMSDVVGVWYYDAATATWRTYGPGAPSDLTTMEDGKAYWVRMKADATLWIHGTQEPVPPDPPSAYPVVVGWNMVGFRSTIEMTDTEYLSNFTPEEDYGMIYGWNASVQDWEPQMPGDANLVPGHGYWIPFAVEGTIQL